MIGKPDGEDKADTTSPMLNSKAIEKAIVKMPLMIIAVIILRGATMAEF